MPGPRGKTALVRVVLAEASAAEPGRGVATVLGSAEEGRQREDQQENTNKLEIPHALHLLSHR
jgi:hypothetical protein